jgi:hypothetical protein
MPVTIADIDRACQLAVRFLQPLTGRDWATPVTDLDWSCQRTLQHVINTELYYAMHLATRASSPLPFPRGPAAATGLSPAEMLAELTATNKILQAVIRTAPSDATTVLGGSRTDVEGVAALTADELLVHTWDIGRGLEELFEGDDRLARDVIDRLFPWAPRQPDHWSVFLWCNGRRTLADRPRLGPGWPRWTLPIAEWKGVDPTASPPP